MSRGSISGILNLNKPAGVTSRDVVNCVQRLVRPTKVGHAGTLDPLATGVLVLLLGAATRLTPYVQQMRKRYLAQFLFGVRSSTEDMEGELEEIADATPVNESETIAVLPRFVGTILQRPPAFSALKVGGQRAYKLARRGESVALQPRSVHIYDLRMLNFNYPRFTLEIECGSGTYVRSLGRDIADSLGTAAIMTSLVRTGIGPFRIEESLEVDSLNTTVLAEQLLDPKWAVGDLPQLKLSAADCQKLHNGLQVTIQDSSIAKTDVDVAILSPTDQLVGVACVSEPGRIKPVLNLGS